MTIYGFLSYCNEELRIPNKELRIKFDEALEDKSMCAVSEIVMKSNEMLKAIPVKNWLLEFLMMKNLKSIV